MQKVLYTAQNVHSRVGCAKSALYNTKCTLESRMFKKCSTQHKMRKKSALSSTKCTLENKSALYSTKCMLESRMYKKTVFVHRILRHTFRLENGSFCTWHSQEYILCCIWQFLYSPTAHNIKCTLESAMYKKRPFLVQNVCLRLPCT